MSNNVTGVKISSFNIATTIDDSAVIPFVSSATNLAISFASFKSALGVTGVIKSTGSDTSTPILIKPSSTVNYVRNIKGSQGIATTVATSGEIAIKTNFANGAPSDAQSIVDPTSAQIKFRGFKAGSGISLEQDGDNITLSANTATLTSKTVIISDINDLPASVGGVITLEDDTDYFIANDITTNSQFATPASGAVVIRAADSKIVTLTYSGAGSMFSGATPNLVLKDIRLVCQTGKLLGFSASTSGAVSMTQCRLSVLTLGDVGAIDNFFISQTFIESVISNGFLFSGSGASVSIENLFVSSFSAGKLFDLGSAVLDRFSISSLTVDSSGAGTIFLSGLANSANITGGTIAKVQGVTLKGSIANFENIDADDIRFNFDQCNTIQTTRPDALSYLTVAATTALTAATPTKINGVFAIARASQMTASTDGRITYNGVTPAVLPIIATTSIEPTSGTNKDYKITFAKNGVNIPESAIFITVSAGGAKNQSVIWQDKLVTSDYYEVFIESTDGTSVQVNTMAFRID